MLRHVTTALAWSLLALSVSVPVVALMLFVIVGTSNPGSFALLCSFLAFPAIGALIVSRQRTNVIGWIFCAVGLGTGIAGMCATYVEHALATHTETQFAVGLVDALQSTIWPVDLGLGTLLLFLFPDGRLPTPRWRPLFWLDVAVIAVAALSSTFMPGSLDPRGLHVMNPLGIPGAGPLLRVLNAGAQTIFVLLAVIAAVSVIVRYRHASGTQRQQIKWFALGVGIMAPIMAASLIAFDPNDVVVRTICTVGIAVGVALLPLGAGIGVLRHRLYDIDVLINRTLVYGSLTAILVGVYLGIVLGAQTIAHALTGARGDEPLVIVASTLLIAALFNPLRRRLQRTIDRRFYRAKYDAAKTLGRFAAMLRQQIELDQLSSHLLSTIEETMYPEYVSLWLSPASAGREERAQ